MGGGNIISLADARERAEAAKALRIEAEATEASSGRTPYTEYLLKHGRRPCPDEARTIGRAMGARVLAADGSAYPKRISKGRRGQGTGAVDTRHRALEEIWRVENALALLAKNECDPTFLIGNLCESEARTIAGNLDRAVSWLARFTMEWNGRGQKEIV